MVKKPRSGEIRRFFDAARYMVGLVDNESIEKDGVVAGSHEIQDDVNDGESRERVARRK